MTKILFVSAWQLDNGIFFDRPLDGARRLVDGVQRAIDRVHKSVLILRFHLLYFALFIRKTLCIANVNVKFREYSTDREFGPLR